jgi:hypothetical protein
MKAIKETTDSMIHLSVKTAWGIGTGIVTATVIVYGAVTTVINQGKTIDKVDKVVSILQQNHISDSVRTVTYQIKNEQQHKDLAKSDSIQISEIKAISAEKKTSVEPEGTIEPAQETVITPGGYANVPKKNLIKKDTTKHIIHGRRVE